MFNDIIYISMKPHVADTRTDEVEEEFRRNVGRAVERSVRNRLDPGLKFRGGTGKGVKVELQDTGRITIRKDSPGKDVVRPDRQGELGKPVMNRSDTVNDLFIKSSGVPGVVQGSNGQSRLVFRTVRDTDLFSRQQEQQDSEMKRLVDHAVQSSVVEAMDGGVREVARRYPSDVIGSEEIPGGDG